MVLSVRKAAIPRPEKTLPSGRELGCEREKKKNSVPPLVGWLVGRESSTPPPASSVARWWSSRSRRAASLSGTTFFSMGISIIGSPTNGFHVVSSSERETLGRRFSSFLLLGPFCGGGN